MDETWRAVYQGRDSSVTDYLAERLTAEGIEVVSATVRLPARGAEAVKHGRVEDLHVLRVPASEERLASQVLAEYLRAAESIDAELDESIPPPKQKRDDLARSGIYLRSKHPELPE